MFKY